MELLIKEKKENHLLNRQELTCEISYDKAMPGRKQIREAVCAASGVAPELLVIVSAKGAFGSNKAVVSAHAYKSKEAMSVERKYLLVRDGLVEKEKKAAKAKASSKK